ncbi:hypothetical protein ACTI_32720 [Actinoplanes sp. OR16]|uniref:DUF4097 family beta strand repeat-containing protein n=1 Tax=Actinoplanes sp. OR16 TaxID=946334 RepID=UPI000F712BC6|nr:DUF4097 family beta strand repeat-containing protein [Actinoplanes sp. OR16]BBH66587.1 hypothetical protein ACTI_32720 [Actinoplanes sp. OR16]
MSRRVALVLAAASVVALAGCDGVVGATMTFNDTETAKITDLVLSGTSGDVVLTTGSSTETRITRVVRGSSNPGPSYTLSGTTLNIATDCGRNCHVSYEITTPAGVGVRGNLTSGDLSFSGTGAVELKMTSGDIVVESATGPVKIEATSGDIMVTDAPALTVELTSGNVIGQRIAGPIEATATSGDMNFDLSKPASVTASVHSGDLDLMVPEGDYQVRTETGSGDATAENIKNTPGAANVLDLRTRSGDLFVTTR